MPSAIEQMWERFKHIVRPKYALALEKRQFERYLRAQGWSRDEAKKAAWMKYRGQYETQR